MSSGVLEVGNRYVSVSIRYDYVLLYRYSIVVFVGYLVPALATNKIAIVVSPLISLMMDQCNSINNKTAAVVGSPLACFLGSGQTDSTMERRVLAGEFTIVYITPEKFENFLPQLAHLHTTARQIGLLAVDEAHCISQWGHDFRMSYMHVGKIRSDAVLSSVPIMALTATASLKVRNDIIKILKLKSGCLQLCNSVDRTNLHITVRPIQPGGIAVNMPQIVDILLSQKESRNGGSTIIYMPTTKKVDSAARYMTECLAPHGIQVTAYHGQMSVHDRSVSHKLFLTGECSIIIATVVRPHFPVYSSLHLFNIV